MTSDVSQLDRPVTDRRKTSYALSPAAAKALARAKYELFARFDVQVTQSEILEALLLTYTRDLDGLRQLIEQRKGDGV